jgi:hypothetical protein
MHTMHKVVLSHVFSTRSFARRHGPNDGPADRAEDVYKGNRLDALDALKFHGRLSNRAAAFD